MKKELLSILIIILFMPFISAIEITLTKETYSPYETLQAEITGHFISLRPENIFIYKNDVPRSNPVISDFTSQDKKYYYYAILPKEEGNYSLRIENAEYTLEGELKTDTIIKDFTIKKTNITNSILTINPGFVVTSNDFSIKIKSPYKNQEINIVFEGSGFTKNLSLIEDEEQIVEFSIANIPQGKYNVRIANYNIPVFILKNILPPVRKELTFYPNDITAKITSGTSYFFKLILENTGEKNLTDIRLTNNIGAKILPENISRLNRFDRIVINITIPVSDNAKKNITGVVKAEYEGKTSILNVFLELTKNQSQVNLNGTTVTPGLSCSRIGKVCIYPEKCIGETTESLEGPCCLGTCNVNKDTTSSTNWIMGIIALAILAVIAFFLVKKARKKPKTAEQILSEKNQKFEQRKAPPEPNNEVRGKLDRV